MMAGAWRFHTLPDCRRIWTFFRHVGRPEIARTLPACTRAAVIGLPLIGTPAATPIPMRPVLPLGGPFWAGEAGGFPGASYGTFGPGAFDVAQGEVLPGGGEGYGSGFGVGLGSFGYAGGWVASGPETSSIAPGGPLAVGVAAASVTGTEGPQTHATLEQLPAQGVEVPTITTAFAGPDVQPVPEPSSLALLIAAVVACCLGRRRWA